MTGTLWMLMSGAAGSLEAAPGVTGGLVGWAGAVVAMAVIAWAFRGEGEDR